MPFLHTAPKCHINAAPTLPCCRIPVLPSVLLPVLLLLLALAAASPSSANAAAAAAAAHAHANYATQSQLQHLSSQIHHLHLLHPPVPIFYPLCLAATRSTFLGGRMRVSIHRTVIHTYFKSYNNPHCRHRKQCSGQAPTHQPMIKL